MLWEWTRCGVLLRVLFLPHRDYRSHRILRCLGRHTVYNTGVTTESCTSWSEPDILGTEDERFAQKYCHECSEGAPVCSSSDDHDVVCAQVAAKTECTAGLTYEDDRWSCSSETGEIEAVFVGCTANGTNVTMEAFAGPCSDLFGYGEYTCYKCEGYKMLCGPPNSSCEELVSDSTAHNIDVEVPVDPCSESGQDVGYLYEYCSSPTEITQLSGNCDALERVFAKDVTTLSCTAWTDIFDVEEERLAQKYCHECSKGVPVCSSSSDHEFVCAQVAAKTECTAGLTYEDALYSCSAETGELAIVFDGCSTNGTYLTMDVYSGTCSDWLGYGDFTCYKCDGFKGICGPPNSTCEELVSESTASSSAFAALSASDLLPRAAAAFCGIVLLVGLELY